MKNRLSPQFQNSMHISPMAKMDTRMDMSGGSLYSISMQRKIWFSHLFSRRQMGFLFGG